MAKSTKTKDSAQVGRLRAALARAKANGVALAKERSEAREQQAASAAILKVISRSPENAQPVFDAIVKRSMRMMSGHSAMVSMIADGMLRLAALTSTSKEGDAFLRKMYPRPITRTSPHGIAFHTRRPSFIKDTEKVPKAQARSREIGRARGYRSMVAVPMVRDGVAVGCISVTRKEPGGFNKHQIELLKTFADQAVIAIENVRRFNETKEALEHQKASADILRVISGSPTDLSPVMAALAESAARLCEATDAHVWQREGDELHAVASHGELRLNRSRLRIARDSVVGRTAFDCRLVHVHDLAAVWKKEFPDSSAMAKGGSRSVLAVPLVREGAALGVILIRRTEVRPFSAKQLALLQTFADQAVIAIENVRLFNETKEALERQTASSEILRVVARSVADAEPVFHAILASLLRLFEGFDATVWTVREGQLVSVVRGGATVARVATRIPVDAEHPYAAALRDGKVLRLDDVTNARDISEAGRADLLGRNRKAVVLVPLIRDGSALGALSVSRATPYPFTAVQVDLLKNFADQATIAIENARLFNETKEALERQTAISEILRVISGSPGDVQPVLQAVAARAARICEAQFVDIILADGNVMRVGAAVGDTGRPVGEAIPLDRGTVMGRSIVDRKPVHVADLQSAGDEYPLGQQLAVRFGHRTILAVPLLREDRALGTILVRRNEVRPIEDKHISLLQTFADQAALAIENARLFTETKEALERQTATGEILASISSSMADARPVFDAIVTSLLRLFGSQFSAVFLKEGDQLVIGAVAGEEKFTAATRSAYPVTLQDDAMLAARAVRSAQVLRLCPIIGNPDSPAKSEHLAKAAGYESIILAPMLREGVAIGVLATARAKPLPFDDRQVALIKSFADQAVIAIENARLFNETKEALERQTATADILKVIAGSPTDAQPVFEVIVESAVRLCGARFGRVYRYDGSIIEMVAGHGLSARGVAQVRKVFPRPASDDTIVGRVIQSKRPFFIQDIERDDSVPELSRQMIAALDTRSQVTIPMLRGTEPIGAITMGWDAPGAFTDQQVALLKTFADQAVIAIENVRLFNETKEALERQTATAEILRVIASSPSDVQPVFDAIVTSAARLFGRRAGLRIVEPGGTRRRARSEASAADSPDLLPIDDDSLAGRVILRATAMQVVDTLGPDAPPYAQANAHKWDFRANAAAPLMRDGKAIGSIFVASPVPGAMSDKQMELLQTFADQAVIAIQNVRLFDETREALERQTATSEILKVISSSPTDVQPVFEAIVGSAAKLFDPWVATITILEGDHLHWKATAAAREEDRVMEQTRSIYPLPFDPERSPSARAILERTIVEIPDTTSPDTPEFTRRAQQVSGFGAITFVPLTREGKGIGTIILASPRVGSKLTDKQLGLVQTFADQAVIAIENVRLFNETKESLERQTATAEILKVIASSPSDVQPVFDAIVASARNLLSAYTATVTTVADDTVHLAAHAGIDEAGLKIVKSFYPQPASRGIIAKVIRSRALVYVADTEKDPNFEAIGRQMSRARGFRSLAIAPLLRDRTVIGMINVSGVQPQQFSDHHLELLRTFADQAVIAIENVRLFNETRESLERQTATAEILKVIASSPSDVQPVFDAIAASARRLLGGHAALVARRAGDVLELAAFTSTGEAGDSELSRLWPSKITGKGHMGKALLSAAPAWVEDIETDPGYSEEFRAGARARGMRSAVSVPMLREGEAIGVISVNRSIPGRFSDHQTNLLKTFADQALIAIENVRLFNELQTRTEALTTSVRQLTALGEVGQAISSTLDLEKVLKTIATHAVRLTGLDGASIYEYEEASEEFRLQVADNFPEEFLQAIRNAPIHKGDGTAGRVAITLEPIQVPDILDKSYRSSRKELLVAAGYRAVLTVPLLREGHIIGALNVLRKTPGAFADEIVELLKTFATQSAMAIQNARLFREIAEKGKQLEEASKHKSQFLASMSHELRTPLNAILGFNEMILGDIYGEVPADMKEPLTDIQTSGKHLLRLINNVLDLAKIEAGRMELALDDYSVHDTVESVRSTLRPLAEAKGLDLAVDVPSDIPLARGDGGRITQCLMNLAGNSLKFTKQGSVGISVALENGTLTYRVRDTGIGIPADKIGGLFTEFKQTDATIASEYGGTGLGLSITKKFIEMHGGRIWAESEPGTGSTFIFEIPLRAAEEGEA